MNTAPLSEAESQEATALFEKILPSMQDLLDAINKQSAKRKTVDQLNAPIRIDFYQLVSSASGKPLQFKSFQQKTYTEFSERYLLLFYQKRNELIDYLDNTLKVYEEFSSLIEIPDAEKNTTNVYLEIRVAQN